MWNLSYVIAFDGSNIGSESLIIILFAMGMLFLFVSIHHSLGI